MSLFKEFCTYYKPHKKIFALDMIASFLVAIVSMFYPIVTRYMLNDLVPNQKINLIIIFGISLFVVYAIQMGLRYFIQYYGHIMGVRMQCEMRKALFEKIERLPYSYFDNHETGKIMSGLTNDLFEISELAHHGPENLFIASFTIVGSFTYLCFINWALALICFAMVPILFGVSSFCRKKMKAAFRAHREAQAVINGSIQSSITGIRVTKAYTNEPVEIEKFDRSNEQLAKARFKTLKVMATFMSSSQFVTDVFNVVILIAGGIFLYNGEIEFGDYSAFIVSINLFISPVNHLIQFMEQFQDAASGFRRFSNTLKESEEIDLGTETLSNVKGEIDFKHVSFSYQSSQSDVLKDISFSIEPGEKVALVGPTGGGKTTICHLLPRFYPINEGYVTIDGKDINTLTLKSLRSNVGIVQQDVFLFGGTIRDNIRYGNGNASEEDIVDACKKANLYDFVSMLPNGLDTEIGERGVKLSGGQKQRISIARTFLKNPSILILDEATSALDNTTEFLIQKALDDLCKNRTTIVVAHRLSTIKNADKILVISGGEIIEQGSHEQLIKENGVYKNLYELQFRTMDDEDKEVINSALKVS